MGLSNIIRSVVGRSAGRGGTTRRTSGTGRAGYGTGRAGYGRGGVNRSGSGGVGGMIRSILNRR